jgi:hypothetical protein
MTADKTFIVNDQPITKTPSLSRFGVSLYKSSGCNPVTFAILASILGPISSLS